MPIKFAKPPADDGEVAQLRIPALHITCLWLKGGKAGDRFEVVDALRGVAHRPDLQRRGIGRRAENPCRQSHGQS